MIKKYKQFNEGIKHLLVGPTDDEIFNHFGLDKLSKSKFFKKKLLFKSAEIGSIKGVEHAIDSGVNIHASDDYALISASANGHTNIVKLLLDKGVNIHADDDYALIVASANGHTDTVKFLLDSGANVHARNDDAITWAKIRKHKDTVELLKKYMER